MIDPSFGKPHTNWPTPISYTIFNPSESDKLCPVCGIYSWGSDTVQCGLCLRWIHYDDESKKCDKYYEDINLNTLRENYICKTCLDILVKYYKSIFNNTDIDGLVNCLSSFNLNNVLQKDADIDVFKICVNRAIENNVSSEVDDLQSGPAIPV